MTAPFAASTSTSPGPSSSPAGELPHTVKVDCFWSIDDAKALLLTKQDQMNWWICLIKGDPEIVTQKVQPENKKLSDLDGEACLTVEKMMGRGSRAVLKWLKSEALVHDASNCHPVQLEGSGFYTGSTENGFIAITIMCFKYYRRDAPTCTWWSFL